MQLRRQVQVCPWSGWTSWWVEQFEIYAKPCLKYLVPGYCYFGFRCKFLHGKIKEKNELCRLKCKYGDKCRFAHGQHEYYFHNVVNNPGYKTKPCQKYHSDVGYCKYGSKCAFLHGEIKEKKKSCTTDIHIWAN